MPVFSPSPFEVMQGAVASFYPDFQEGGVEAGKMIARVLKGESPAKIPFYRLETTKTVVNQGDAGEARHHRSSRGREGGRHGGRRRAESQ